MTTNKGICPVCGHSYPVVDAPRWPEHGKLVRHVLAGARWDCGGSFAEPLSPEDEWQMLESQAEEQANEQE